MSAWARLVHGKNSVHVATGILAVTLLASNVLGLVRDRFLAVKIPADQLDSYYAAFRLPDLLTNFIVIGAIAVIFIPVFTQLREDDEQEAWSAASAILNMMVLILTVGAVILWALMPYLMPLVVPHFDGDKLAQTVTLARWLSLTPILFGVSYILSGLLNSYHRFTVYSLAPLVYNLSIILATILFADRYGVYGVVGGVLVGALLHMAIQLPVALVLGWQWRPLLTIHHPAVKKIGLLMLPRTVGLLAMQMVTIVATAIASGWVGAITYYNFANNIQTMPTVVFANSIATVLFPVISQAAAKKDFGALRAQLVRGIRWIIFLLVPASVGLILLRIQIVRLVLGAGHFDWVATQTTADVLGWFTISAVGSGLIPLLARAFYARQDMKTPMTYALISATTTIGLSFLLVAILPRYLVLGAQAIYVGDVAALAIAFSIGTLLNAWLLLGGLKRTIELPIGKALGSLGRILLATVVMAMVVQIAKVVIGLLFNLDYAYAVMIQLVIPILVGAATYAVAVAWLRCPEWHELTQLLRKKISTTTSTTPA